MDSAIGLSEFVVLVLVALLLLGKKDALRIWEMLQSARAWLLRFRYDLEDALYAPPGGSMDNDPRQVVRVALDQFDNEARFRESQEIVKALLAHPLLEQSLPVAAFYPLPGEPDITPWLQKAAAAGHLLLPRTLPGHQMEFVAIHDLERDLQKGRYGIREPRAELPAGTAKPAVFLVPGVVFGQHGERLGHGAGYYDRYLAAHPHAHRIGIAYSVQMWPTPLPQQPHDIAMHEVLSGSPGLRSKF